LAKMVQQKQLQQLLIWLSCFLICGSSITRCHIIFNDRNVKFIIDF
jgi:hypothetical protein